MGWPCHRHSNLGKSGLGLNEGRIQERADRTHDGKCVVRRQLEGMNNHTLISKIKHKLQEFFLGVELLNDGPE